MKFIHISDTHLGATTLGRKFSPSGANQREEDICHVFAYAIDRILELKPDFVLHCGDLFHSVRPSNRIIDFALRQFIKLSQANIPTVVISGNHDSPKQRGIGSIYSILDVFPHIYPVYRGRYETKELHLAQTKEHGPEIVLIHCIPHCLTDELFQEELKRVKISENTANVLMLHGVVSGIPEFSMGEFAEQMIPDSYFGLAFDYVALGHYHKYTPVQEKVFYAGSTERISFNEIGQEKGFLEVNLSKSSAATSKIEVKFHPVPARQMIDLPGLDAFGLDQTQLEARLEKIFDLPELEEKIIRMRITNLPQHIYQLLPFRKINQWKNKAFFCDLRFELKEESGAVSSETTSIGRLNQELLEYLNSIVVEGLDKKKLSEMGLSYMNQVLSEADSA